VLEGAQPNATVRLVGEGSIQNSPRHPCLAELATGAEVSVQQKLFDHERCDAMQRRDGSGKSVLSLLNRKTGLQLKAGPMRTEST
jgi:hypothetical protein